MMKKACCTLKLATIFLVVLFLSNCVAVQTFPIAARSGDTITLALGSADNLDRSTVTSVTYTPDGGSPVDITTNVRSIFKLYPDKRSVAWTNSASTGIPLVGGHGAWLDVMVIDLPTGLPPGTGVVKIQTTANYHLFAVNPNDFDIGLEILPGVGSPASYNYIDGAGGNAIATGVLENLEPLPHYQIKPVYNPSWWAPAQFAAVEITVTGQLTGDGDETSIDNSLRVVPDDMYSTVVSQKQVSWKRNGGTVNIFMISPTGKLAYYETFVSLFFTNPDYGYVATPTVSIRYFDINGYEVSGPPINIASCDNTSGCV